MPCKNVLCEIDVDIDDPGKAVQFIGKYPVLFKFSSLPVIMFFIWVYSTFCYFTYPTDKWKDRKHFPKGLLKFFIYI